MDSEFYLCGCMLVIAIPAKLNTEIVEIILTWSSSFKILPFLKRPVISKNNEGQLLKVLNLWDFPH